MYSKTPDIQVGDLVEGTSMHNTGLVGFVVDFDPNRSTEYKVQYLVKSIYSDLGYYILYERSYDIKKIS